MNPSTIQDMRPVSSGPNADVNALIASGKCKQAVELAKEHHKRANTVESRRLLVQTYVARIEQFHSKGMGKEAQTLLEMVQQRFPAERHLLEETQVKTLASGGRIDELLRPLASEQISPGVRASIENALARNVTDLAAVASCRSLPPDHPVRAGAAAIWKAFSAVTSGPVNDSDVALTEISHRSPFAGWKMAIRALALFYRHDDAGCRRALDAIPAESAVKPVETLVRQMLDGVKPALGIANVLYGRIAVDDRSLKSALEKIESYIDSHILDPVLSSMRDALRQCAAGRPELLDKLRRNLFVVCITEGLLPKDFMATLGRMTVDAGVWQEIARRSDKQMPELAVAVYWERFLRHAVAEGLFSDSSHEAAAVWLHIGKLLSPFSLRRLTQKVERMVGHRITDSMYHNRNIEITDLCPKSDQELLEFLTVPGQGFAQAAAIQPRTQIFDQWLRWAQRHKLPEKQQEDIAMRWHASLPRDVSPLVVLSAAAEVRNALSLAKKRITEAETIDPLNKQVRSARIRLTMAITWRHFHEHKAHLVEKDIADLRALPSMNEGDRAAVVDAMTCHWHSMQSNPTGAANSRELVVTRLGRIGGEILLTSIKAMATRQPVFQLPASVPSDEANPSGIASLHARLLRLSDDLNLKIYRPTDWLKIELEVLRQTPCPISNADVLVLGMGAAANRNRELAYQASVAGLARADSPALTARFLLLRANSLNQRWQQPRTTQCLRAALELAKQAHDEELLNEVFSAVDADYVTSELISGTRDNEQIEPAVLQLVLDKEKQAVEFPTRGDINAFVIRGFVKGPDARFSIFDGFDDDDDWDDEDDFDDEDDDDEDDETDDEDGPGPFDEAALPSLGQGPSIDAILRLAGAESSEGLMSNPQMIKKLFASLSGGMMSEAEMEKIIEKTNARFNPLQGQPTNPKGNPNKNRRRGGK